MNIKKILKENGITLGFFAKKLDISRPTLDSYILLYEKNEKINNKKIQIAFEELFGNADDVDLNKLTTIEFYNTLEKYSQLIKRDKTLGITDLNPNECDLLTKIFDLMINDIKQPNYNENIYIFIRFIINNYRNMNILNNIAAYYLSLNLLIDYNQLNESSKLDVATYYVLMKKFYNDNEIKSSDNIKQFEKRILEIKKERDASEKKLTTEVKNMLISRLEEAKNNGIDIEKLSVNELIELLKIK